MLDSPTAVPQCGEQLNGLVVRGPSMMDHTAKITGRSRGVAVVGVIEKVGGFVGVATALHRARAAKGSGAVGIVVIPSSG